MAFSATSLTVTVNAIAKILLRVNPGDAYHGQFLLKETLDEYQLDISHLKESLPKDGSRQMERHLCKFTHTIYATATEKEVVMQSYTVIRGPINYAPATQELNAHGLVDFVDSGTVLADMIAWQS